MPLEKKLDDSSVPMEDVSRPSQRFDIISSTRRHQQELGNAQADASGSNFFSPSLTEIKHINDIILPRIARTLESLNNRYESYFISSSIKELEKNLKSIDSIERKNYDNILGRTIASKYYKDTLGLDTNSEYNENTISHISLKYYENIIDCTNDLCQARTKTHQAIDQQRAELLAKSIEQRSITVPWLEHERLKTKIARAEEASQWWKAILVTSYNDLSHHYYDFIKKDIESSVHGIINNNTNDIDDLVFKFYDLETKIKKNKISKEQHESILSSLMSFSEKAFQEKLTKVNKDIESKKATISDMIEKIQKIEKEKKKILENSNSTLLYNSTEDFQKMWQIYYQEQKNSLVDITDSSLLSIPYPTELSIQRTQENMDTLMNRIETTQTDIKDKQNEEAKILDQLLDTNMHIPYHTLKECITQLRQKENEFNTWWNMYEEDTRMFYFHLEHVALNPTTLHDSASLHKDILTHYNSKELAKTQMQNCECEIQKLKADLKNTLDEINSIDNISDQDHIENLKANNQEIETLMTRYYSSTELFTSLYTQLSQLKTVSIIQNGKWDHFINFTINRAQLEQQYEQTQRENSFYEQEKKRKNLIKDIFIIQEELKVLHKTANDIKIDSNKDISDILQKIDPEIQIHQNAIFKLEKKIESSSEKSRKHFHNIQEKIGNQITVLTSLPNNFPDRFKKIIELTEAYRTLVSSYDNLIDRAKTTQITLRERFIGRKNELENLDQTMIEFNKEEEKVKILKLKKELYEQRIPDNIIMDIDTDIKDADSEYADSEYADSEYAGISSKISNKLDICESLYSDWKEIIRTLDGNTVNFEAYHKIIQNITNLEKDIDQHQATIQKNLNITYNLHLVQERNRKINEVINSNKASALEARQAISKLKEDYRETEVIMQDLQAISGNLDVSRQELYNPQEILNTFDQIYYSTLHQNEENIKKAQEYTNSLLENANKTLEEINYYMEQHSRYILKLEEEKQYDNNINNNILESIINRIRQMHLTV